MSGAKSSQANLEKSVEALRVRSEALLGGREVIKDTRRDEDGTILAELGVRGEPDILNSPRRVSEFMDEKSIKALLQKPTAAERKEAGRMLDAILSDIATADAEKRKDVYRVIARLRYSPDGSAWSVRICPAVLNSDPQRNAAAATTIENATDWYFVTRDTLRGPGIRSVNIDFGAMYEFEGAGGK